VSRGAKLSDFIVPFAAMRDLANESRSADLNQASGFSSIGFPRVGLSREARLIYKSTPGVAKCLTRQAE
jgi:hypothetical protein